MKKHFLLVVFSTLFILGTSFTASAQCKSFTKKNCLPELAPYIYNGQLNSAVLTQGDAAELMLTFYPDQDYRIFVCHDEALGNVEFELFDANKHLLFSNKDNNYQDHWDFTTNATMQIIVRVVIPEKPNNQISVKSGCVSILVGFKNKKK